MACSEAKKLASRKWYVKHGAARQAERLKDPATKARYAEYHAARYLRLGPEVREERKQYGREYRKAKPWQKLLQAAARRATKAGIEFALTPEWAEARYTGRCEITGTPFDVEGSEKRGPRPLSPSIDRLDQCFGYVPGNCRFILFAVNAFRGSMTDDEMLSIAESLVSALARAKAA
jgi:hypothetical protein